MLVKKEKNGIEIMLFLVNLASGKKKTIYANNAQKFIQPPKDQDIDSVLMHVSLVGEENHMLMI